MGILDTPARSQRQNYNANMPLIERLITEGRPYNSGSIVEGGTYTTDGSIGAGFTMPGLTQAYYIDTVIITCNKNARVQLSISTTGISGSDSMIWTVQTSPGVPIILPIKTFVRPAVITHSAGGPGGTTIRNVYDADKTGVNLMAYASGYRITDDLNFGAEKVYLHMGDSITAGGTGVTNKSQQYDWQILNYFKDKGHNLRMINVSVSGSDSRLHESRRLLNGYEWPQADFIGYSLGANDATNGITQAEFQANVAKMIAWKQSRYPSARMIVFGSTPHENDTNEANAALIRTAGQAAVTAAADPQVTFLDLGTAFNRTTSSNYASTDTAGSRIHPSTAGHAAIFNNVIKPFLDANPNVKP